MADQIIYSVTPISFRLDLKDPFIFTAHHVDYYPEANPEMGPKTPPQDKEYNMYYGDVVPGFPEHPHTGFETITIVERGFVDHFDSMGNAGRYAAGDVQWLTTGNGVEHCEMFPLLNEDDLNTFELFQIWFNSSPEQKKQPADYKMFWREHIPHVVENNGAKADLRVISGEFKTTEALERPPHSWAHAKENKVNIYLITLEQGANLTIPATTTTSTRFAYFYQGEEITLADQIIPYKHLVALKPNTTITLTAHKSNARVLWLEGEPIGKPVAMRGPFVLNTEQELNDAFKRYRETRFGEWPWPSDAPVFHKDTPRYATYEGGKFEEYPDKDN